MAKIVLCVADPRSPQPKGDGWKLEACFTVNKDSDAIHRWVNGSIIACASRHVDVPSLRSKLVVPTLHVSVSDGGHRASDDVIRGVLADFSLEGAEEDNHSPGLARHFWLDEGRRVQPDCECKRTEETVVEPDGYRWQRERLVK